MKFLFYSLITLLTLFGSVMFLPNAYADDFLVNGECVEGIWTGTITNLDGDLISNASVRTMEKITENSFEKKFITDENGIVEISFTDNTGIIWIQKGGFNDNKTIIELCDSKNIRNSNDNVIIKTDPDRSYQGEFWDYGVDSGIPVGVVIDGELEDNGLIKLTVQGNFYNSSILSHEQIYSITSGNPKHLFFLDYPFIHGKTYTLVAENGNSKNSVTWVPLPLTENVSEDEFRKLPSSEKKYTESMNILGKVIRIFDDKICVEEYCKQGEQLPVHIQGNVGINTKSSIKLQITHLDKGYLPMLTADAENYVIGEINTDNLGGGNFYADWIIRKTSIEGVYGIAGVTDGRIVGPVGNSMMDIVNGAYNHYVIIVSNLSSFQSTQITEKDATIFVDIEYGQTGGIVNYEICAKRDISNPAFEILSDVDRKNIVTEIELKKGDCIEGKHMMMAKAPATIVVPLGTEKSASSEEINIMKNEIAELKAMLSEKEDKPKVPGWIKNNVQWWADGQVDDQTFVNGIGFMVKEKIIDIPTVPESASNDSEQKIPDWIRNNAVWWSEGIISEDDFINGIEFLVQKGIVRVP
jgi:hypothetical protein